MKAALLIIDVQNDYFLNGKCELQKSEEALDVIKQLLQNFRNANLPIFFVQHIAGMQAPFFVAGTYGAQLHKDIKPRKTETVIVKHVPNSFHDTNLHHELMKQEVSDIIVCGMMTHMCIDTSIRAAKDYGYGITLISDGCATKDLQWNDKMIPASTVQSVFMAALHQKFANVITCAEYL